MFPLALWASQRVRAKHGPMTSFARPGTQLSFLIAAVALLLAVSLPASAQPADVQYGAAPAQAVRDGRIAAVGRTEDIRAEDVSPPLIGSLASRHVAWTRTDEQRERAGGI